MIPPTIFGFIQAEEARFETEEIRVGKNWSWSMSNHIQLIFHLKNGIFYTGENNWLRAFKNIMEPILNLSDWMEDLEVKDVVFYIESQTGRVLSFLIKKYHDELYTKEHDLEKMFDDITEGDNAYGGVLVQKGVKRPEALPLQTIAFCDQTDILGGPIGFKHHFSPSKLRKMSEAGWGKEENGATISIEDLIVLAENDKEVAGMDGKKNHTTGKTIEVYVVRGDMPEQYLKDNNNMELYYSQLHVVAFYVKQDGTKEGVCLYRKADYEDSLMFFTSKEVYGRALGRGVGEIMLHPQIWTNFLAIHKMNFLEAASKVPLYTDDQNYQNRNKIQDMENLEITTVEEGKKIFQVPTAAPVNVQLLSQAIAEWYDFAQLSGSAFDPLLGKGQPAGTTFKGQERVVSQASGSHEKKRGQRAKFIEKIYRAYIIPEIVNEIVNGKEFLATLTGEEIGWVSEQMADNFAFRKQVDAVLDGQEMPDREMLREVFKQGFEKEGNRHLIKILKDEFRDIEIKIGINIANKQKDLAGMSDKLLSVLQYIFSNPQGFLQAMKIPALAKSFNDIIEFSGLNQADFATLVNTPVPQMQDENAGAMSSPLQIGQPTA